MRTRPGFSLVELLIVIAIIGILAIGGILGARALLDRARLSQGLATVERQVSEARRLAKRLDRDVPLQVLAVDGTWQIVVDGRAVELPGAMTVTTGIVDIDLEAPFGTYSGTPFEVGLDIRGVTGTATVTGVLARTVVQR